MPLYPRILPVGESALTVEFGGQLDESLNRQVHALDALLSAQPFPGLVETVPTYRSLLVTYEPRIATDTAVHHALESALESLSVDSTPKGRLVEIPVRYGGEFGPDLDGVADHCGLTAADVIRLHTEPVYRVAMLGFAPGFAYLFGLDARLAAPRLATPRLRVEPGSVGIAGPQTGVYALSTPGGWRIIGRTMLTLFDPKRAEPFMLNAADCVKFVQAEG